MKYRIAVALLFLHYGCPTQAADGGPACPGDTDLPPAMADMFEPTTNAELLAMALGEPEQGKLCEGQVYRSKPGAQVTLYRAWNSTNPNSKKGNWWAFEKPEGPVAQYRSDYEVCYQWSPLDVLVSCTLKPGVEVVIGPGQSAKCSEFLTYPASDEQQVFIDDAAQAVADCTTYRGEFSWKKWIHPAVETQQ